jgi:membrane protease YdiL (CAAX protease family)
MESLVLFLPFVLVVILANLGERQPVARYLTYASLIATNLALVGAAALALVLQLAGVFVPDLMEWLPWPINWPVVALVCFLTSLVATVVLLRPVRSWVSRRLPLEPDSMVHTTALAFAAYLMGLSLAQAALIGDLENLILAGLSLTVWDVLLTGLAMLLFALAGVGLVVRRDVGETLKRLGVGWLSWRQLVAVAGTTAFLLALDYGVNVAWQAIDPAGYGVLVGVNEYLFGNLMTVGGALVLGLSAGISEELLFRGALQPRLGLVLAALLFTVGHLQYGFTVAIVEVFLIGLVLGLVRNRANTTACIIIHASYNTVGVLLGMLQP